MPRLKLPPDKKRVPVYGRIAPESDQYLRSLGEKNFGRSIDRAVSMASAFQYAIESVSPESQSDPKEILD